MEKRIDVRTVKVYLFCDECGEEMLPTGDTLMSSPPQYLHVCKNGHRVNIRQKRYPYIDYVDA